MVVGEAAIDDGRIKEGEEDSDSDSNLDILAVHVSRYVDKVNPYRADVRSESAQGTSCAFLCAMFES